MDSSTHSVSSDGDLSDYDVISNPGLDFSIADLALHDAVSPAVPTFDIHEPSPSQVAIARFRETISLTPVDIQQYVRKAIDTRITTNSSKSSKSTEPLRTIRVYVDGLFDGFSAGNSLQLRQAKLSFPSVHLMVGVFSDELCSSHDFPTFYPHVERCEVVRSCRWVDEVVDDAPWRVDEYLLHNRKIDYIAVEEGITVDPMCDTVRVKGYDEIKTLDRIIPTRRTFGITAPPRPHMADPTPIPPSIILPNVTREPPIAEDVLCDDTEADSDHIPEPKIDVFGIGY